MSPCVSSSTLVSCLCLSASLLATTPSARAADTASESVPGGHSVRLSLPAGTRTGFALLNPATTGVSFTNVLVGDLSLTNAVPHNGSGVALGDIDADGRVDIYLCGLQSGNRLYRNLGNWRFEPVDAGEAACAGQLSTGAAFADVDGDGDLDLLVNGIAAGTRLFLNDGKGHWTERKDSGLARATTGTSMALADIDGDGDLDLYVAHYIDMLFLADPTTRLAMGRVNGKVTVARVNGQPANLPPWKDRFEVLPDGDVRELAEADGFYRNDGRGHFTAIQDEPGLFQDANGQPLPPDRRLGLGAMFRDVNGDGAPDLYVCNDNGQPSRFWINNGKGTFREIAPSAVRHASHSSMGLDFADIDRDGRDDLLVLDMLARDRSKRLMHPGRTAPDLGERETAAARPLFSRNSLYLGRADGTYAEAAWMAGLAATDWSWCPVFLDVDLDGYEDLLVTNGFEQDVLDQDSTDGIRKRKWTPEQVKRYRQVHPRWDSNNLAFRNRGNGTFEEKGADWGFDLKGVSNGMAVADLDNDGDLDVVVNNLNAPAALYRNEAAAPRIAVRLKGTTPNTQGIGARLTLTGGPVAQSQEMIAGGRYLSCDEAVRVFAGGTNASAALRLEVRWRNGRVTRIEGVQPNRAYEVDEAAAQPAPTRDPAPDVRPFFADASALLAHTHAESTHDDWAGQPLLPRRLSRMGPALAWCDIDGDGWEDLIVTASLGAKATLLPNREGMSFAQIQSDSPAPGDQASVAGWSDGKGNEAFLVAVSNLEMPAGQESQLTVYAPGAAPRILPAGRTAAGPIAVADIDGDGDLDVFLSGQPAPGRYPEPAPSTVWRNEGGQLKAAPDLSEPFKALGIVRGATFADLDGDGDADLIAATEWGPIRVFLNERGRFTEATEAWGLAAHTGLWTGVAVGDFDGDGRLDIAAGNWGRNTPFELEQPATLGLFHGDWSTNGVTSILEASRHGEQWLPVRDRSWLARGFPEVEQRIPTHAAFGQSTAQQILGNQYASAHRAEAAELESAVFLNRGTRFERVPLPREAQLAPAFSVNVADFDGDGVEDLFVSQNFFGGASNLSREDNGRGLWLRGKGDGTFVAMDAEVSGVRVDGEQRGAAVADFNHDGRVDLAVAQNGGATRLFANQLGKPGLRIAIRGPIQNPHGLGAQVRIRYAGRPDGPVRSIQGGSGLGSQDGLVPVLGLAQVPTAVWIRWPGGREQVVPVPAGAITATIEFGK